MDETEAAGNWPTGVGEMACRIREHDWAATPLGPTQGWPQSLKTVVDLMLASPSMMSLVWGSEAIHLYNDRFTELLREHHRVALGRSAFQTFAQSREIFAADIASGMAGKSARLLAQRYPVLRNGRLEDAWFDVDYAPVRDDTGKFAGVLWTLKETTAQVLAERALREREARHRLLIESWTQAIWETDAAGFVVADSPSWRAYTGQTLEEWLGYGWLNAIHPDDRAYADRQWRKAVAERAPLDSEFRLRAPHGGWRWTNVRAAPVLDEDGDVEKWVGMNIDIDDRKLAEHALRESEERYRTLFQSMDEAYTVVEVLKGEAGPWRDFRFLEVNPAFLHHTAMPWPVGKTATELLGTPNPRWTELYGQALETGQPVRVEESEPTLGRIFDLNIFALDRVRNRVAVLFTDVTDRRHAEDALRESEERQGYLLRLSDVLRPLADPFEIIGAAMRLLGEEVGASRAYYAEWPSGTDYVEIRCDYAGPGLPSLAGRYPIKNFRSTNDRFREGRTWVVDDAVDGTIPATERDYCLARGVAAWVNVPLVKGGKLQAALFLVQDAPRCWNAAEIAFAEETAERTWAAVQRSQTEAALRESEERFRLIVENARDYAIFTLDTDGRIADWFPGAEQVFGWSLDEARGHPVDMTFTAEDRAAGAPAEERETARREGTAPDVRWHVRKDGSRVFIDGITNVIRDPDGRLRGYLKIGQNVTERRAAGQALRESDERFREFGEASSDLIWIRNAETMDYEYVSPAFDAIYGRTRAEVGDELSRWMGIIHPDDREGVMANLQRVREGERVNHEFRIVRPDGEVRWIRNVDFPLRDLEGRITRIGGIGHDATVGKQAADALRESEERFRSFADASEDVMWIVDAETRRLEYVSPAFEQVWGEPREAIMADLGLWAERIYPDDLPHPGEGIEALLAGRNYTAEYRIQRRDGTTRYIRDTGFPIFDNDGRVCRVAGVAQDLTERRNAERAVIESELRLRTLMEGIPQLVWRSRDEGRWTWSSPQWQDFTGQTQEGSHGLGWLEAVHPDDRDATMRAWKAARARGMLDIEYRVRRASDGAYLWHHTRSVPVRDEAGRILEWLGTTTDVEELKELQERQAVLVAELQHRTRNLMGVVRSMSDKTARASADLPDFRARFRDRLEALSRVQGLLSRLNEHDRVTFDELVRTELSAMDGASDQVTIEGPEGIRLRSSTVQTLAMALHELATNALKYGALSQPGAKLAIRWSVDRPDTASAPVLQIDWRESGVEMPSTSSPLGTGQGRELIERALPYQLSAETTYELGPDGVHCTIAIPVSASNKEMEEYV